MQKGQKVKRPLKVKIGQEEKITIRLTILLLASTPDKELLEYIRGALDGTYKEPALEFGDGFIKFTYLSTPKQFEEFLRTK